MSVRFTKLQGIGNDFVALDAVHFDIPSPAALGRALCDRRFGIGADGLILACPSAAADMRMRIINPDGSEAEMCGNGIRCAAKFMYDSGLVCKTEFDVETLAGVKHIRLQMDGESAVGATVDMGVPQLTPEAIPVAADTNLVHISLDGRDCAFFCVNTGVPHAVTFDYYPEARADFWRFGEMLETHPLFPKKTNVEFCRAEDSENIRVKVWERAIGPTLACGTGSCAALVAAATLGLTGRSANVHLPGGTLRDEWLPDGRIFMTGPARSVFTGEIALEDFLPQQATEL